MQITVFGASGKVGTLVVEEALKRGYGVVAFVHSHELFSPSGRLVIKKGDIYSSEDVTNALAGSQAVVSCLGSWGTKGKDVLSAGMRHIIPAMSEQGIERIVTLTGSGAAAPGRAVGKLHSLFQKILMPLPAGKVFADGERHMRLLADSQLAWTTVRSPVMTGGKAGEYELALDGGGATIRRASVAVALLDQLEDTTYLRQAPIIRRKRR